MPTPSEQKALAFVAIVILLAGAVRLSRSGNPTASSQLEQRAIEGQLSAVDSAASTRAPKGRKSRKVSHKSRDDDGELSPNGAKTTVGAPAQGGASSWPQAAIPLHPLQSPTPYLPPNTSRPPTSHLQFNPAQPIDLDQADAESLDRLPKIGPATAKRIVANRDSFGPFGSMDALKRVKGLGPATLKRLAPLVTFSGRPASSASRRPYY